MSEAAKFIQSNEKDLTISWSPGAYYSEITKTWTVGICGTIHSGTPVPNTEIPKSLVFVLKTENRSIYDNLKELLKSEGVCNFCNEGTEIYRPLQVKAEFKTQYDELMKEYHENIEKGKELIKQLRTLGFRDIEYDYVTPPKGSDEWYERVGEIKYTPNRIEICCRQEDPFYKEMSANGLFEKYFPKWYKEGKDPEGYGQAFTLGNSGK